MRAFARGFVLRSCRRGRHQCRDAGCGVGRAGSDVRDADVGADRDAERFDDARISCGVDGDDQRAVAAGSERSGGQVVGPALGSRLGQRPLVGIAQAQGQHGRGQHQEQDRGADGIGPGVAGHVLAPAPPARAVRDAVASPDAADSEPIDPRTGEAEERGQQRDRGDHHDQHEHRDRDPGGGHHRHAGDRQAEDGDDHGAAGEDDGLTGGLDGTADRLLDRHATCEVLAVPGDEEEGVVDADTEADHAAQLGHPAGDLDQVGDERHRADAEGEAEQRERDREARGDDGSERDEQDQGGDDQPDQFAGPGLGLLEREEQVAAHFEPQRRTRNGLDAERLEVLQVVRAQLLEHRIAEADERDATVCGHRPTPHRHLRALGERAGRIARAEDVRERGGARLDLGQRGPLVSRAEERRALVAWRHDQLSGEPGQVRPGEPSAVRSPGVSRLRVPRTNPRAPGRRRPTRR